jgi:MFS family permease
LIALASRLSRITPFYYGWIIVVIAGLANASRVSSAVEVASVFVPSLEAEYGWNKTTIASATSIGGVAVALSGPIVGRILDRYGSRIIVPIGSVLTAAGCLSLAGVSTAWLFIASYAFVRFSGQALVQFPNQVAVAKWFERRRGTASSALVGIGAIGLITAPIGITAIIDSHGMGPAWVALALLALTLGVLPSLLFGARNPEDLGLQPDGGRAPSGEQAVEARRIEAAAAWTLSEAVRTPALWLICGSTVLFSVSSTGVGFHQLAYYVEQGMSSSTAAAIVSVFAVGVTFGGVGWGLLADRFSVRWLVGVQYVVQTLVSLALLASDTPIKGFALSFVLGLIVGGALSLPTLLLATYYGRRYLGAISGILQTTRGVSLGSGPVVAALIYDLSGGYEGAFITFAAFCLAAFVMMLALRRPIRRVTAA